MRIGMDRNIGAAFFGGGIYNYELAHIRYLKNHKEVEIIDFQPTNQNISMEQFHQELTHFIVEKNLDIFHIPIPFSMPWPEIFLKKDFPKVHLTATVYDLIPYRMPQVYLSDSLVRSRYFARLKALLHFDRLLSISEFSRQDFIQIGVPEHKIVTIGTGPDDAFFPLNDVLLNDFEQFFSTESPFVLGFTVMEYRKNASRLSEAFARATQDCTVNWQLVFVGHATNEVKHHLQNIVRDAGRPNCVFFTGFITKEQLLRLYNRAKIVAFPSLYEGWGLPVLEALQCGKPVLTSNVSALPEVAGNAALYVNPWQVDSITDGLKQLLFREDTRKHLCEQALIRVKGFSWVDVANKTVDAFKQLCSEPRPTQNSKRLLPNRYRTMKFMHPRSQATYVSFDLSLIPLNARIIRATLRIPVKKSSGKIQLQILRHHFKPKVWKKQRKLCQLTTHHVGTFSFRLTGDKVYKWDCTRYAHRWHKESVRNKGLILLTKTSRAPSLTVTYFNG